MDGYPVLSLTYEVHVHVFMSRQVENWDPLAQS